MLSVPAFSPVEAQRRALDDLLVALVGIADVDGEIRLFQNNLTVSPLTVLGDLTEADFSGYAAEAIAGGDWQTPAKIMPDGSARQILGTVVTFDQTASTISNTVYGWYWVASDGTLELAGNFPTPLVMDAAGKFISLELAAQIIAAGFSGLADVESNG